MLDIGWTEMLLIGAIAVVVVGPRDLPKMLTAVGRWVRKARSAVRELQTGIEDMAREAELDEVKRTVEQAARPTDWWEDKPVGKPTEPNAPEAAQAGEPASDGSAVPAKLW